MIKTRTNRAKNVCFRGIGEHGSIRKTPEEKAGIKLDLGQNKIENLIKLASKRQNIVL